MDLQGHAYLAGFNDSLGFIELGSLESNESGARVAGVNGSLGLSGRGSGDGKSVDYYEDDDALGDPSQIYRLRFPPYTALSIACLLFNILSLLAMSRIRGRRTVHHTLLINLAVCDMTGSVLLWMYYNSPYLFPRFELKGVIHCLFILVVLAGPVILSISCSALSLLLLAVNQYIAICSPLFSQTHVTTGKACLFITGAWLIAGTAATVPVLLMLIMSARSTDPKCIEFASSLATRSIEVCTYVLAGLIVIIIVLYARIYREVLQCRRRTNELTLSVRGRVSLHARNATEPLSLGTARRSRGENGASPPFPCLSTGPRRSILRRCITQDDNAADVNLTEQNISTVSKVSQWGGESDSAGRGGTWNGVRSAGGRGGWRGGAKRPIIPHYSPGPVPRSSTSSGGSGGGRRASRGGGAGGGGARHDPSETNYKAFITTLLLTGTLVVFWLPFMIFHFLSAHINLDQAPAVVIRIKFYIIDILPMLTFLTDPLIYGVRMREIRRAYHRLISTLFPCCPTPTSQSKHTRHHVYFERESTTRLTSIEL